jgi:hypothetical protein
VKTSHLIAACLAMALPTLSMSMDAEAAGKAQRGTRGELVHQIVMKWGNYVQEAYRADVGEWASDMVPVFAHASLDALQRAADAPTFDAMNDAFLANGERSSIAQNTLVTDRGRIVSRSLGEIANDLVFVPITPCRIIDTRLAGGQIAANSVRSFDVTAVGDYAFQGGDASNCGGAGAAGSFAAAAINFTVVTPGAAGYITAFPFLGTQPVAATVNYGAGDIRGNFAVVKLDQGASANELSVYSFAQTHLVADLVGYYINPQATQLDCVEVASAGVDIAAGSFGSQTTPNCPAGYEITGGGCSSSTFDGKIVTSRSFDTSATIQNHFCAFRNQGAGTANFVAYGRCCRTPGR